MAIVKDIAENINAIEKMIQHEAEGEDAGKLLS